MSKIHKTVDAMLLLLSANMHLVWCDGKEWGAGGKGDDHRDDNVRHVCVHSEKPRLNADRRDEY